MSRRDLIDPESRVPLDALLEVMPGGFNAIPDIVARRAAVEQIFAMLPLVENPDVAKEDRTVPGPDGDPDIQGLEVVRGHRRARMHDDRTGDTWSPVLIVVELGQRIAGSGVLIASVGSLRNALARRRLHPDRERAAVDRRNGTGKRRGGVIRPVVVDRFRVDLGGHVRRAVTGQNPAGLVDVEGLVPLGDDQRGDGVAVEVDQGAALGHELVDAEDQHDAGGRDGADAWPGWRSGR